MTSLDPNADTVTPEEENPAGFLSHRHLGGGWPWAYALGSTNRGPQGPHKSSSTPSPLSLASGLLGTCLCKEGVCCGAP